MSRSVPLFAVISMIADRWELIGQGLLIDSTGDRWVVGLTRFLGRAEERLRIVEHPIRLNFRREFTHKAEISSTALDE
jgi:hypothetical protein